MKEAYPGELADLWDDLADIQAMPEGTELPCYHQANYMTTCPEQCECGGTSCMTREEIIEEHFKDILALGNVPEREQNDQG